MIWQHYLFKQVFCITCNKKPLFYSLIEDGVKNQNIFFNFFKINFDFNMNNHNFTSNLRLIIYLNGRMPFNSPD